MKKTKLSRKAVRSVVTAAVLAIIVTVVLVINIFIPVKYLSAYLVFKRDKLPENSARVTFIDVGFGDSILAELPDGKVMLIDGGNGSYSNQLKILSLLNKRGVDTIDYLICTSVKSEHCGGLTEIIKYKSIEKIYLPYCTVTRINNSFYNFNSAAYAHGNTEICEYGNGESGDGWSFSFLSPTVHAAQTEGAEYFDMNSDPTDENINNASAVIWLTCAGVNFLFMSDATSSTSVKILAAYYVGGLCGADGNEVKLEECDVVSVAMHGAEGGTCTPLYDLLSPSAAVISVGENSISAPSVSAIADAQAYTGDDLYRTDIDGTVTVTASGGKFTIGN